MTAARPGAADPAGRLLTWLFERTLPWWATHGVDPDTGGFHERPDANRKPFTADGKRAMVQARQTAAVAQAYLLNRLPAAWRSFPARSTR